MTVQMSARKAGASNRMISSSALSFPAPEWPVAGTHIGGLATVESDMLFQAMESYETVGLMDMERL